MRIRGYDRSILVAHRIEEERPLATRGVPVTDDDAAFADAITPSADARVAGFDVVAIKQRPRAAYRDEQLDHQRERRKEQERCI